MELVITIVAGYVVLVVGFNVLCALLEMLIDRLNDLIEYLTARGVAATSLFVICLTDGLLWLLRTGTRETARLTRNGLTTLGNIIEEEHALWTLYQEHGGEQLGRYRDFRRAVKHDSDGDDDPGEERTRKERDMSGNNELDYPRACALFGLPGTDAFGQREFKQRYRLSMSRYHPDKTGGSAEMAKALNEAAKIIKQRRDWS